MTQYLEEGEEPEPDVLHDPFEKALREGHIIPICFTSAKTGAGIDELLEIVVELMPNPLEGNPPTFLKGDGKAATRIRCSGDADAHALAHAFKISIDPFIGRMGVFRIHQGHITRDSQLYIDDSRKPFRVAHLLQIRLKSATASPGISVRWPRSMTCTSMR